MAYKSYKKHGVPGQDSGSQDYVMRLRDEYAIPRAITELHIKAQPYLNQAMISAFNDNQEMENENRLKFAYYFLNIVTMTVMLPKVREVFESKNPENKDVKKFILKIASYAKDKVKTSELLEMYLSYADIMSECGLLEAYDRRESVQQQWESGF